ncbi:hypothetical protein [Acidithiobacillus thiooxidans]|uniref:hypothetical protein n=1 Tax=Acidithiobacillus thiooxidans TaxID=930 RepID=UPI0035685202
MSPIHIHTFWRSGKTYLFNKIRSCEKTLVFYEPFHHFHSFLTPRIISLLDDQAWPSHHPRLLHPYFFEYVPLLRLDGSGVEGYSVSFSELNFFDNNNDLLEQKKYLFSLIDYAENCCLSPVLIYGRSMGRLPWMLKHMRGKHISLQRSIRGLWHSSKAQWTLHNDPDYLLNPVENLIMANMDQWIQEYFVELGLLQLRTLSRRTENIRDLTLFLLKNSGTLVMQAFCAVIALGYALAESYTELIVDLERISDWEYRQYIELEFRERYSLTINLHDCNIPEYSCSKEISEVENYYYNCLDIARQHVSMGQLIYGNDLPS